jgi:hypothetical protein
MNLSDALQSVNSLVKTGLKKAAVGLRNEALVVGKEWIQDRWNRFFASKNILILGPKGTGKTSLIYYLLHDHPYQLENGDKRPPNPTATAALVDEKFKLQHANWQKLKKDVPGDEDLRKTWKQAIDDVNPRGIIYMIDGRKEEDELLDATEDIRESVLKHYDQSLRNLTAFHIFLNFADEWAETPEVVRTKRNLVRKVLEKHVLDDSVHQHLRTEVSHTQLSPNARSWDRARRALFRFGADLVS